VNQLIVCYVALSPQSYSPKVFELVSNFIASASSTGERERERERETETERQRERDRERETETERETERETETETETERDRERQRETERDRETETERDEVGFMFSSAQGNRSRRCSWFSQPNANDPPLSADTLTLWK